MFDKLKKRFSKQLLPPADTSKPIVSSPNDVDAKLSIMATLQDPVSLDSQFNQMLAVRGVSEYQAQQMRTLNSPTKRELVRLWLQASKVSEREMEDKENIQPSPRKRNHSSASDDGIRTPTETKRQRVLLAENQRLSLELVVGETFALSDISSPQEKDGLDVDRNPSSSLRDQPGLIEGEHTGGPLCTQEEMPQPCSNCTQPKKSSQETGSSTSDVLSDQRPVSTQAKASQVQGSEKARHFASITKNMQDVVSDRERNDPKSTANMGFHENLVKLRTFLRAESLDLMVCFIEAGGLEGLVQVIACILNVEWREQHETGFLVDVLQCIRVILRTSEGANKFYKLGYHDILFPKLTRMQFSWGEERRAFFKFEHRQIIVEMFIFWIRNVTESTSASRAELMLGYLHDFSEQEKPQHEFIAAMYKQRRYKNWYKELNSTTVPYHGTPWMYWHKDNVIQPRPMTLEDPYKSYIDEFSPTRRPELISSTVRSHTETLVSQYVAANLDLMNVIIVSLPRQSDRNALRQELKDCGFEGLFGKKLRLASQKNFPCIAEALQDWVSAAQADSWSIELVTGASKKPTNEQANNKDCLPLKETSSPPLLQLEPLTEAIF